MKKQINRIYKKGNQRLSFYYISILLLNSLLAMSQTFPLPPNLSTGQGVMGGNDPVWQVSQQCFAIGTEPNPTSSSINYTTAAILSTVPSNWINPTSLSSPLNNGNWIGSNINAGTDDVAGCARYYRLPINLPLVCGVGSVTTTGVYSLVFEGYADDMIISVFLNGINQNITPGGSFSGGSQLTFTVNGPWQSGSNFIDVLVENDNSSSSNPSGFFMTVSPSLASKDFDGDGVSNLLDMCPCMPGTTTNGCPAPNQCNVAAIRSAFTTAGCTELPSCYDGCSLYFYLPTTGSSQNAESFAQSLGGHVVSIQTALENNCLNNELISKGYSGVTWIGLTDNITEGSFYWLDGSPVTYTNWAISEPNNNGGNEDCVQMYPDGKWNDLDCLNGAASILEVGLCPQAAVSSSTLQLCAGGSTTFSVSTKLGSAPYTYTWSPALGLSSTTSSNPVASPSVTTSYTVQSVDRYGCTAFAYVTLTVNPIPTLIVNTPSICKGQQTATLVASGAASYSWSPSTALSSTTGSLVTSTPSATTIYTVVGKTSAGCVSATSTFVKVNAIPTLTISATSNSICFAQQSSNITVSGALSYTWSPSSGLSSTTSSNVIANPTSTKTYTVIGTNSFGCYSSVTKTIVVNPLPAITVVSASICTGQQTATLIATGASIYNWAPNSGLSSPTGSMVIANPSVSTTYSILGTDANGCKNFSTTMVTLLTPPVVTSGNTSICIGLETATLTATGASTYSWNPTTNLSSSTGSMVTGTPTATTIYTVTGTDANGCYGTTTTFIKVNKLPTITVISSATTICKGQQSVNFSAGGGVTYSWTPSAGLNATVGANVTSNTQSTTTYSVYGVNGFGCKNFTTTTINVLPLPIITVNSESICPGQQTATLVANGANTYMWAPASSLNTFTGSVVLSNPVSGTTYSILGTDANGCKNFSTANVSLYELPPVVSNNPSICTGQQSATLIAMGAINYSWTPNTNLSSVTGSMVVANPTVNTTYTVTGKDANGCYRDVVSVVSMQMLPIISANNATICVGQQTATLIATGAASYSWSPNVNLSITAGATVSASPSVTTTYTIQGTDSNGCKNITTSTVTLLPLPTLSASNSSICLGQQTATLYVNGATTYTWLPGLATGSLITVSPNASSIYTVVGTDGLGCKNYAIAEVTIYSLPTITVTDASICFGQQTATLIASNGISYSWTPSNDLSSSTGSLVTGAPMATTMYTIIGIDSNGCADDTTATITVNDLPVLTVSGSSVCPSQFEANVLIFGANSYSWEPAVTYNQPDGSDINANPSVPTDYTITAVDIYGCYNTTTTNVGFFEIPTASITVSDSILCIGESFVLNPTGGSSFEIQPDNLFALEAFTLTPSVTSTYTLIVYSDDGCFSVNNPVATVTVNSIPTISAFTNTQVNIGQTTQINAVGGASYQWSPVDGLACATCSTTNARPLENTYYVVRGFDSNGCSSTDTVFVKVDYVCGEYFVPNGFTPNGDGVNDFINLHNACIGTYVLQIFDRWGEKIFETSDIDNSWNGTFRGKAMDSGVFMYQADGLDLKGTPFSVKGNITLFR